MKNARIALIIGVSVLIGMALVGSEAVIPEEPPVAGDSDFGIGRMQWDESTTSEDRIMRAILVRTRKIELSGTEKATIQTNKGAFVIELFSEDAPNTVVNFIRLAESGFYDGLIWHRYVPDFVIQGGDPTGTGSGNPGYSIDFEANDRTHEEGAVGMARSMDINSASCQFYVCLEPCHGLDGSYCVFGKTIEGMEVVQQLRAGDSIIKISVHK